MITFKSIAMKKIMFLLLLSCCTCSIFAQENTDTSTERKKMKIKVKTKANDMSTRTDMQTGALNNNMGSSTFTSNTRITIQGWTTDPASLPVVGTGVSADVVTNIKNKYGTNIYDIKKIRVTSGDAYAVRVMENGQYNTYYVGGDGNVVPK